MAQQTAVDWLLEKIIESNASKCGDVLLKNFLSNQDIEQAKQIEKEQIINAYKREACYMKYVGCTDEQINKSSEKYYNENFKSE